MEKGLRFLIKLLSKYLSIWIVFFIDVILSTVASAFILLLSSLITDQYSQHVYFWLILAVVASIISIYITRSYRIIIRHSSLKDVLRYIMVAFLKICLIGIIGFIRYNPKEFGIYLILDALLTLVFIVTVRSLMIAVYDMLKQRVKSQQNYRRIAVYGTSDKAIATLIRLKQSVHYHVVGFVTPQISKSKLTISDHTVFQYKNMDDFAKLVSVNSLDAILFATDADVRKEEDLLVKYCVQHQLNVFITPHIDELRHTHQEIRELKVEDLLCREEIKISMDEIMTRLDGKSVLVTGAAGSIGSELCRQLATFNIKKLILVDNAETPMHNLSLELKDMFPKLDFVPIIGDVRSVQRMDFVFRTHHPQLVFHAAAYKHVPLMEDNPCEAIRVNTSGSRVVADKCLEYDVQKMIMISTDKAVNPTNIMGCSKRLAEIYVQSLGLAVEHGQVAGKTRFITTRFGNVLGSNGSVIPRFLDQIQKGGPITVTDPRITRFFMTIPEACRLVMEAATIATGTQIFVFDMGKSVKIDYLARKMIELKGLVPDKDIKIVYTGLRPGEKLYEEVLANTENTLPTEHDRIHIAKVREYDYAHAVEICQELDQLAQDVNIPALVREMKKFVPEFVSNNSKWEQFDA